MIDAMREEEVYRAAYAIFSRCPDWVTFFREVLGVEGLVRREFNTRDSLAEFEQTETYQKILFMVSKLRERLLEPSASQEPTQVITVRLPKSLHDALREEAHEHKTSVNKLAISKLMQAISGELVPADIRGKKKLEVDL